MSNVSKIDYQRLKALADKLGVIVPMREELNSLSTNSLHEFLAFSIEWSFTCWRITNNKEQLDMHKRYLQLYKEILPGKPVLTFTEIVRGE